MDIGENIKQMRIKFNISQGELAKKIGTSQSMLCQIERGTKCTSMELGKQIAKVFGCTLDDLAKGTAPKEAYKATVRG